MRKDTKNCFFSFNSQYKKNIKLSTIKKGTVKLKTDSIANVLGATKGKK